MYLECAIGALVLFVVAAIGLEMIHHASRPEPGGVPAPARTLGKVRGSENPPTTTAPRPGELAG